MGRGVIDSLCTPLMTNKPIQSFVDGRGGGWVKELRNQGVRYRISTCVNWSISFFSSNFLCDCEREHA